MKAIEDLDKDESSEDEDDDDEKDEIAHLARRISKAWIKRKKKDFVPKKDKKGQSKARWSHFALSAKNLDTSNQNVQG